MESSDTDKNRWYHFFFGFSTLLVPYQSIKIRVFFCIDLYEEFSGITEQYKQPKSLKNWCITFSSCPCTKGKDTVLGDHKHEVILISCYSSSSHINFVNAETLQYFVLDFSSLKSSKKSILNWRYYQWKQNPSYMSSLHTCLHWHI